jgi:hypothetical protein
MTAYAIAKAVVRTIVRVLIIKARPIGSLSKSADYNIAILSLTESSSWRIT